MAMYIVVVVAVAAEQGGQCKGMRAADGGGADKDGGEREDGDTHIGNGSDGSSAEWAARRGRGAARGGRVES